MAEDKVQQAVLMMEHVSGKTAVIASVAGLLIGAPLIGLMGMTFACYSDSFGPNFIIFSPVLLGAVCILAFTMLGFGAAGAMALVGVASLVWILRSFMGGRASAGVGKLMESGDEDQNWLGNIIEQKAYEQGQNENLLINTTL